VKEARQTKWAERDVSEIATETRLTQAWSPTEEALPAGRRNMQALGKGRGRSAPFSAGWF
jgi:hypothetical protein